MTVTVVREKRSWGATRVEEEIGDGDHLGMWMHRERDRDGLTWMEMEASQ